MGFFEGKSVDIGRKLLELLVSGEEVIQFYGNYDDFICLTDSRVIYTAINENESGVVEEEEIVSIGYGSIITVSIIKKVGNYVGSVNVETAVQTHNFSFETDSEIKEFFKIISGYAAKTKI